MLRLAILALAVSAVHGDFVRLQEVCRSVEGNVGLCVTTPFCCTSLGGTIESESKSSGTQRGAMPEYLARSLGEDDGNKGCSYNGQCCIFPEVDDFSCDVCGLKGNGDISKENVDVVQTTTTTQPPVQVNKEIVERIVNGQDADRYEWCWQVALMNATGLFGGGALISRNWVVTAAHKVAGRFLDEFVVVLGEYDFAHAKDNSKVFYSTALNVFLHPGFNPETFDFNIALIRIPDAPCDQYDNVCAVCLHDDPITFTTTTTTTTQATTTGDFTTTTEAPTTTYAYGGSQNNGVRPSFSVSNSLLAINRQQENRVNGGVSQVFTGTSGARNDFSNLVCYMTGWGSTGVNQLAPVLQEAYIGIIRDDTCEAAFTDVGVTDPYIPEGAFCGAEPTWTRGSCYGDGGGPLVCQNRLDHTWELYGIISLGTNMCMLKAQQGPSIFTDVGQHFDWIVETVHEDLPDPADDEASGKTYKVPECGSNVSQDGTVECPTKPPYEAFNRRTGLKQYRGPISIQQLAVLRT